MIWDGVIGFGLDRSMGVEGGVGGSRKGTGRKDRIFCSPVPVLVKR